MNARARWVFLGVALVVVLGLVVLSGVLTPTVRMEMRDGKRTWIIHESEGQLGTDVTLSVRPEDAIVCELDGVERRKSSVISDEHVGNLYLEYGPASGKAAVHCGPPQM